MNRAESIDPGAEIAVRLRRACEAHDTSIGSHLDRVAHYACEIGRLMGLSERQILELHHATPLHDVGKIGVPVEILNKPGRLTREEMNVVKSHTVLGHRILEGSEFPLIQCAARIALAHHEDWDGTGYPNGLSRTNIPLDARIVAVADVYDALMSQRAYKPAWEEEVVLNEMRSLRERKFDPQILDLFLANISAMSISA
jgi:HD-GYP domain-containing protein (c-di-GMP phosphodiesterase class II)